MAKRPSGLYLPSTSEKSQKLSFEEYNNRSDWLLSPSMRISSDCMSENMYYRKGHIKDISTVDLKRLRSPEDLPGTNTTEHKGSDSNMQGSENSNVIVGFWKVMKKKLCCYGKSNHKTQSKVHICKVTNKTGRPEIRPVYEHCHIKPSRVSSSKSLKDLETRKRLK